MPRYRVIDGQTLRHGDLVVHGGAIVELPAHVGNDQAVKVLIEPVDAPVVQPPPPLVTRTYRVREGQSLPHAGALLTAGAVLELPAHVAADPAVSFAIEPVPDPEPIPPVIPAEPVAETPRSKRST